MPKVRRASVESIGLNEATLVFDDGERVVVPDTAFKRFDVVEVNQVVFQLNENTFYIDHFETEKRKQNNQDLFNKLKEEL